MFLTFYTLHVGISKRPTFHRLSRYLHTIENSSYPDDSQLFYIGTCAFAHSTIESFSFPPHLTSMSRCAFAFCDELHTIDMHPISELKIIEEKTFYNSLIHNFTISPHLTTNCENAFTCCKNLKHSLILLKKKDSFIVKLKTLQFLLDSPK